MYEYPARVERWVDGDTVDLRIDLGFDIHLASRVRLYGINTPETRTRDLEEKKRGLAAKARVNALCPVDSGVVLKTTKDGSGKYGRILGTIMHIEKGNINDLLVKEGHATEYFGGKR